MMLFAALTISVAANAKPILAFHEANSSTYFWEDGGKIYVHCGDNCKGNLITSYQENPYANANYCAPGKSWCTCYKYCFNYNGTTYYFNL